MKPRSVEFAFQFCPVCARENPVSGAVPFRCESCGYSNFFGPVAAVGALVTRADEKLLLVRRAREPGKGQWGLPGGFVDRNETVEQALTREVLEETSLVVSRCDYMMSYPNSYNYRGIVVPVIDLFYVCQVDSDEPIKLDPIELDHFEWTRPTPAHLEQMAFHSNRLAIEHWLR